jgi:hypothetical protein
VAEGGDCWPTAEEVDVPTLTEKYLKERGTRLRGDSTQQHPEAAGVLADVYGVNPHSSPIVRDPNTLKA